MNEWLLSLVPYSALLAAAATTFAALVALTLGLRRPKPRLVIRIEQAESGPRFYRESRGEPYYVVTVANKGSIPGDRSRDVVGKRAVFQYSQTRFVF